MVAESFLRAFHDRHPGATTTAYARGRCHDGRSSYEILAALVPPAARVLDLGCGDGYLLELLAADPARALAGIDLSAAELAAARRRPPLRRATLAVADARAIPFATGSLDACVSHLAFTLMSEPDRVAAEIARVLPPGGRFAAVVGGGPAMDVADDVFDAFLGLLAPRLAARPRPPRLGDPRARHAAGLDAILGPAGFGPATCERVVIDLGGTADEVWATLATLYELAPLSAGELAALRAEYDRIATASRVPCAMAVGLVTALRR